MIQTNKRKISSIITKHSRWLHLESSTHEISHPNQNDIDFSIFVYLHFRKAFPKDIATVQKLHFDTEYQNSHLYGLSDIILFEILCHPRLSLEGSIMELTKTLLLGKLQIKKIYVTFSHFVTQKQT